jgi:hypothetical protein
MFANKPLERLILNVLHLVEMREGVDRFCEEKIATEGMSRVDLSRAGKIDLIAARAEAFHVKDVALTALQQAMPQRSRSRGFARREILPDGNQLQLATRTIRGAIIFRERGSALNRHNRQTTFGDAESIRKGELTQADAFGLTPDEFPKFVLKILPTKITTLYTKRRRLVAFLNQQSQRERIGAALLLDRRQPLSLSLSPPGMTSAAYEPT